MIFSWFRKHMGGQALFDVSAWVLAVLLASILRFEFDVNRANFSVLMIFGALVGLLHWIVGKVSGLYASRFLVGSFDELVSLALVTISSSVPVAVATFVWGGSWGIPRSIVLIAAPIFVVVSGVTRSLRRLRTRYVSGSPHQKKAIVYGAGHMSELLVPQLLADSSRKYRPVALIDDDPEKSQRWIAGVKMKGTLVDLPHLAGNLGAEVLIVAIPRADAALLERVKRVARPLGLKVVVLPSFSEILDNQGSGLQLRELGIEDLIGRRAVSIDSDAIQGYIEGRTVIVTGAGGSIGIELCKQVARYHPERLVFLDRDETGLQLAQLAATGSGLLNNSDIILADIRDREVIQQHFLEIQPDVVFHAAALKHLPALERFPGEAWKTNVVGTANVLSGAARVGVRHFVNISTDKAADPTSILGKSKKIAEELTSWYSSNFEGSFHSVRFGNVLGSRGSLVPTLQFLIENERPISITHPEATRFFMTIPEACQLVLQAGSETHRNSILILDMGNPVRIMDIVNKMIELSGKTAEVDFCGLRPGEKLHEDLLSAHEELELSSHPLIWRVASPQLDPESLANFDSEFEG